ncbi:MAG: galactose mutarotase [Phycisphaeraceae bacterium]|nr:galactose mutarotase [Phycisphaeraceae bacterium]
MTCTCCATPWGLTDGQSVQLLTLRHDTGLTLKATNLGCIITELHVPDRRGHFADIVLGCEGLSGYLAGHPFFGAIAGRCANRIAKGQFNLDGRAFQLALNNNAIHHLHGGDKGFDKHVWDARLLTTDEGPAIRFHRVSPDGEEHYPGNLDVTVTYTLTADAQLIVRMAATCDKPTLCNLAQHTYWNLAGHDSGSIAGHILHSPAATYLPNGLDCVPLGRIDPVRETPFDFTTPKTIGQDLHQTGGQPVGYDNHFIVPGPSSQLRLMAAVHDPVTGRRLELLADQPGFQLYTGNFLEPMPNAKCHAAYARHGGFCLETQIHPDAIHHPDWPSPILRPGQTYQHTMVHRFSAS